MASPGFLETWRKRIAGTGVGSLLARGATLFLVIQVVGMALGFGSNALVARVFGAGSYGTYVYVQSWLVILLLFGRMGMATSSLRFVSAFAATEDWGRLRGFLRASHAVVGAASLTVALLTAAVILQAGDQLSDPLRGTFFVACLALPVQAFLEVWAFMLRSLRRVLISQVPGAVLHPVLVGGGAIACAVWAADAATAPLLMTIHLGASSACALVAGTVLARSIPERARRAPVQMELGGWFAVAGPIFVFNALNAANQHADMLLVGAFLEPEDAGVFAAARRVGNVIPIGLTAVNAWVAPLISDLYARGDQEGLQRLTRAAARTIFVFTLPVVLVVLVLGRELLSLFGPEFTRGYLPLAVIALGQLVNALVGPVGLLMTMTSEQKAAAWILGVTAALGLALGLAVIPTYGILGAAAVTTLTRTAWNVAMAVAVWKRMRLRATIL